MSSFLQLSANDIASAGILLGIPSFVRPHKTTGRKAVGLRYERKVLADLSARHPHFVASPWFRYTLRRYPQRVNYLQPDGLLIDPSSGVVTIVEVKYNHTSDAYFQTVGKYVPVLQHFFRGADWKLAICEVVYWFDGTTAFPAALRLLDDVLAARPGIFNVHIARP